MSDWRDDMNDRERAEQAFMESMEGYCDYCENTGHTFRTCAARDDEGYYADDYVDDYDPEEIAASKSRHPSRLFVDPDEDAAIIAMENDYEKYLDRMKEHGP